MSALLQEVLTSRLASTSLNQSTAESSSSSSTSPPSPASSPQIDIETDDDDDELVGVSTAPGTSSPTPFNLSRPSSPPPGSDSAKSANDAPSVSLPANLNASNTSPRKRSALAAAGLEALDAKNKKNKTDPIRALPSEISQRIFLSVPLRTLLSCSLVCKRWRRSATLNYAWYKHYQSTTLSHSSFDPNDPGPSRNIGAGFANFAGDSSAPEGSVFCADSGLLLPPLGSGGAKWTRRESHTDWKVAYGKARRQEQKDFERSQHTGLGNTLASILGGPGSRSGSSGASTPSRSQRLADAGIATTREMRQAQWSAEEAAEREPTKNEMREYYKGLGNKGGKVKGKSGKGGVKTGSKGDGGLWD